MNEHTHMSACTSACPCDESGCDRVLPYALWVQTSTIAETFRVDIPLKSLKQAALAAGDILHVLKEKNAHNTNEESAQPSPAISDIRKGVPAMASQNQIGSLTLPTAFFCNDKRLGLGACGAFGAALGTLMLMASNRWKTKRNLARTKQRGSPVQVLPRQKLSGSRVENALISASSENAAPSEPCE